MMDVIISGYSSFDRMIKLDSEVSVGKTSLITNASCGQIHWGGCSVNIATALSRLGIKAGPVLRVGDDYVSSGFKAFVQSQGLVDSAITPIEGDTGSCSFLLQMPNGEHITTFYPGAMDEKYAKPLDEALFQEAKIAVMTVASHQDNIYFLDQVKKSQAHLYFGMKADYNAFPKPFLEEVLSESQVVFMNETEANQIVELFGLERIEDLFKDSKTQYLVITLGSQGAMCHQRQGQTIRVEAITPNELVDTTGAGDAFISGFIYGKLQGYAIEKCLRCGAGVSSFVLEAEGCTTNLPDKEALEQRVGGVE